MEDFPREKRSLTEDHVDYVPEEERERPSLDPKVVRSLKRKADLILLPILSFAYLLNSLDRSNVANANTAGLEDDLHLVGNQFNQVLTYYQIPFIVFGPVFTVVTKIIGARYSLSAMMVVFGIASLCTGFVKSYGPLIVCRVFVAVAESGFLASVFYYLSVWYTRNELSTRVGIFYGALVASSAFGGLFSFGMFQVTPTHGFFRWSYLFFLEGGLTTCWGAVVFFCLPSDTRSAKFLTDEEKETARKRIEMDSVDSLETTNSWREFLTEFKAPHIYIRLVSTFIQGVTLTSNANFLAMIVKGLGFGTVKTNLLTIAPALVGAVTLISFCRSSDYFRERGYHIGGSLILSFVGYIILYCTSDHTPWGIRYFAIFLCTMGAYPSTPLGATWTMANIPNLNARALTIGLYNSVGNCAGLLSSNIYLTREKPRYQTSLSVNLAMAALGSAVSFAYGGWMRWENRRRDKKGGTTNTTANITDTKDPRFRFQY